MSYDVLVVPLVALTLAQIASIATSVYLHRGLAHRAPRLHPLADVCFRAVLWLTTGQSRRQWVAVHRKHHTFTDQEGDPHSPRLLGIWRAQLFDPSWPVIRCLALFGFVEVVGAPIRLPREQRAR